MCQTLSNAFSISIKMAAVLSLFLKLLLKPIRVEIFISLIQLLILDCTTRLHNFESVLSRLIGSFVGFGIMETIGCFHVSYLVESRCSLCSQVLNYVFDFGLICFSDFK